MKLSFRKIAINIFILLVVFLIFKCAENRRLVDKELAIQPYEMNPNYWQYKGKPVVLLGGSEVDNLFQLAGDTTWIQNHLDELQENGVNYVRCTMSSRSYPVHPQGGIKWTTISWTEHPYPFKKLDNGKYDLNQWNPEYWRRLDIFLKETYKRDIIVQVEVWDAWNLDMSKKPNERWNVQPWNPDNNINYSYENTCCERKFGFIDNPFFKAVPEIYNDTLLLKYQKKYIGKIVDACLQYSHVIFQIDNESPLDFRISDYWAKFIKDRASDKFGRTVYVCDSRRFRYPALNTKRGEYSYPEFKDWNNPEIRHPITTIYKGDFLYNFSDISQNQGNGRQKQYDNILWYRQKLAEYKVRPLNAVKSYWWKWETGQPQLDKKGTLLENTAKIWRALFAGIAAVRYHRIWSDNPWQKVVIRSARMFVDSVNVFSMKPDNELLSCRSEDEAYCLAEIGEQYAVYFTGLGGDSVVIDLSDANGKFTTRWLDISNSSWGAVTTINGGEKHTLVAPAPGPWGVVIKRTKILN